MYSTNTTNAFSEDKAREREEFTLKNGNDEDVVSIAAQYDIDPKIEHEVISNLAKAHDIKYVNDGIGSLVCKMLEPKSTRHKMNKQERQNFIKKHQSKCAKCAATGVKFEIDHINPIASGGADTDDNMQLLCKPCHQENIISK